MSMVIASHKHGSTPPPDNATVFATNSVTALELAGKVKPITG
ncbi:hypothetical protein [Pseudomonas kilonensis]